MVKCPKCSFDVAAPVKTWSLPSGRGDESGIVMGIFECPNCKARFRSALTVEAKVEGEGVSIKSMSERIKGIRVELMQTLKSLREKIKTLESERANLLLEIEKLKKIAESRVVALESEVTMLREEVKSLRELLGYTEEK
jgi:chromosome segregation ATPase